MTYATPNFTQFMDLFIFINNESAGMFGIMLLISLWSIMFFSMKYYRTEQAFATASIITAIVGGGFIFVGIAPATMLLPLMIIFIISLGVLFIKEGG